MMKLKTKAEKTIHVNDMKDGDVAIIRRWETIPGIEGRIVQRYLDDLITLGARRGESWPGLFGPNKLSSNGNYLVELLPPGTEIVV